MSFWPSTVTVAGTAIPLDQVLAELTVHHGREDVNSELSPATCQLVLSPVTHSFVQAFHVGDTLAVNIRDGAAAEIPRFTGWITDATLEEDTLTVIGAALSARLSLHTIGTVDWPAETWSARVTRCFTDAGLAASLELQTPKFNPPLAARTAATAGATNLADYLNFLAPMVGAAIADRPNGKILVQPTDARTISAPPNLVTNGDFETDIAGWVPYNPADSATLARSTVYQHSGQASLRIVTSRGLGGYPGAHGGPYTLTPGNAYTASAWVYVVEGIPVRLAVYGNALGTLIALSGQSQAAGWQYLTVDFVAHATVAAHDLIVQRAVTDGAASIYADEVRIVSSVTPPPQPIDPALVAYVPVWTQQLPAGNKVTVRYTGDQSQSVTVSDAASIAIYEERPVTIDTAFSNTADATTRANQRLARSAYPHWNIPAATILRGLDLKIGQAVTLTGFPPAAPYNPWTPILEGWTDQIAGDEWTMELALSDPLASALLLPWNAVPASYLWNTINPATAWKDALTLDTLTPV